MARKPGKNSRAITRFFFRFTISLIMRSRQSSSLSRAFMVSSQPVGRPKRLLGKARKVRCRTRRLRWNTLSLPWRKNERVASGARPKNSINWRRPSPTRKEIPAATTAHGNGSGASSIAHGRTFSALANVAAWRHAGTCIRVVVTRPHQSCHPEPVEGSLTFASAARKGRARGSSTPLRYAQNDSFGATPPGRSNS